MQTDCAPRVNYSQRFASLAVLLLFMTGCDTGATFVDRIPVSPHQGVSLTIACPDARIRELLERHSRVWALENGATVTIIQSPFADAPQADIGILPPAEVPRFASANQLKPIPDRIRNPGHPYHLDYVATVYREKLLIWDTEPVALPITGEGQVMVYRRDRFLDPDVRQLYEAKTKRPLVMPATWPEYAEVAAFFTELNGHPSLPPLPTQIDELDRAYFNVVACYQRPALLTSDKGTRPNNPEEAARLFSFHYDLQTMIPRLTTPAFVESLKWFQRTTPSRPVAEADSPIPSFIADDAMMGIITLADLHALTQAALRLRPLLGIGPIPGSEIFYDYLTGEPRPALAVNRVPYVGWGGTLGVVRESTPHADAAFDLLTYLGDPTTISTELIAEPRWGVGPSRNSHTDSVNAKLWNGYDLDATQRTALIETLHNHVPAGLVNPVLRLRIPTQESHQQALMQAIHQGIMEKRGAMDQLQAAQKAWETLDAPIPLAERQAMYRLSLSLIR